MSIKALDRSRVVELLRSIFLSIASTEGSKELGTSPRDEKEEPIGKGESRTRASKLMATLILLMLALSLLLLTSAAGSSQSHLAVGGPSREDMRETGGRVKTRQAPLKRPTRVKLTSYPDAPRLSPEQLEHLKELKKRNRLPGPPVPESRVFVTLGDQSPPDGGFGGGAAASASEVPAPLGPSDFAFFRNNPLSDSATANFTSTVGEPSAGNNDRFVFISGNWYATISRDGGTNFEFVDPFTSFPSVNAGFCCDQHVIYDPSRDLLFWLLLYVPDNRTNTMRLAIASGQDDLEALNFNYYDFTPQDLGLPNRRWFDYPQVALSDNFLYVTANVFNTILPFWTNTVIMRLPLDAMSQGDPLNYNFYTQGQRFNFTPTMGATSTMYWASHNTRGSQTQPGSLRFYRWEEASTTIFWDDKDVTSWPSAVPYRCPSPDGTDACGRLDPRVSGGWVSNGVIGFMWNGSQGRIGGCPTCRYDIDATYPYVHVVRFEESTRNIIDEPIMIAGDRGYIYPSVSPNARGHIAGSVFEAGGTQVPNAAVFILDDLSGDPNLFGWELYLAHAGTNGPSDGDWGDYLSARPHAPFANTWMGTGFTLQGGKSDFNTEPRYLWFGRERDRPAADLSASLEAPAEAMAGQTISVTDTAINIGASDAGPFGVGIYLSNDNTCLTSDTLLGDRDLPSLASENSDATGTSVTIPTGTPVGPIYLCTIADYRNEVTETNETNNTTVSSLNVVQPLPDVTVILIPDSATVPRGGRLNYTVEVRNNSGVAQTFQYWTYIELASGVRYPVSRELLGPFTVNIAPGGSGKADLGHAISKRAPLGTYTYHGNVGPYPAVWDSDSFEFSITAGP